MAIGIVAEIDRTIFLSEGPMWNAKYQWPQGSSKVLRRLSRQLARCNRAARAAAVICVLSASAVFAQTPAPAVQPVRTSKPMVPITVRTVPPHTQPQNQASSAPKQQAPLPHLYWHFLMYQNHLDRAAALHEQQGKNGAWLRDHFQKQLGFTDTQFAVVRAAAQSLEPELKQIRVEAMAVVKADRELAGISMPTGGPPVPGGVRAVNQERPGRARLHELQLQHEAAIAGEIDKLKKDLGPEASAKLESYLQNDWSRHVTATHFRPPASGPVHPLNRPFVQGVHP
jgi:hypothetical protein